MQLTFTNDICFASQKYSQAIDVVTVLWCFLEFRHQNITFPVCVSIYNISGTRNCSTLDKSV